MSRTRVRIGRRINSAARNTAGRRKRWQTGATGTSILVRIAGELAAGVRKCVRRVRLPTGSARLIHLGGPPVDDRRSSTARVSGPVAFATLIGLDERCSSRSPSRTHVRLPRVQRQRKLSKAISGVRAIPPRPEQSVKTRVLMVGGGVCDGEGEVGGPVERDKRYYERARARPRDT